MSEGRVAQRGMNLVTGPVGMQTSDVVLGLEEENDQQLMPGIPDEITLCFIVPRLPWRTFHILSSVCHSWQRAIQNRQVYDARVCSLSTERLVIVTRWFPFDAPDYPRWFPVDTPNYRAIGLYSMRDKAIYELPPIPHLVKGIPTSCQCISLNGKIYVLGGEHDPMDPFASNKVYVLDVAGQRQWKESASMQDGRTRFGCGVIDGKIYVFGGLCSLRDSWQATEVDDAVGGSEVYDPEENSWSRILPTVSMASLRWDHHVATVGAELFLYGGRYPSVSCWIALFLEVFHPGKNEWRKVENFAKSVMEKLFFAEGKWHLMTMQKVLVYEAEEKSWTHLHSQRDIDFYSSGSWTHLHSNSFSAFGPRESVVLNSILPVNDELLAVVEWYREDNATHGTCFLQSSGFNSENKEITWEKVNGSVGYYPFKYHIEL